MAYIGYQPSQLATAPFAVNTFTGDGSTTTFTLSQSVPGGNEAMIEVVLENVIQSPIDAYTVGGGTNTSLVFSEAPISGGVIYVIHKGEGTYNLQPSSGSVTSSTLDPVLRNFTVDTYTGNASTTTFTLTDTPYSANSIIVTVDGIVQTATTNYTVSGTTLSFGTEAPASGAKITVVHMGFSTGNKSVADGTITTVKLNSAGIAPIITGGTITGATFAAGAVGTPSITTTGDTNTGIYFPAADTIAFTEGGTEAMRIDSSGNVLINGTTAATSNGGLTITNTSSGSVTAPLSLRSAGTANGSGVFITHRGVTAAGAESDYNYIGFVATDTTARTGHITFHTASGGTLAEKMRIDSSGSLGIGTASQSSFTTFSPKLVVGSGSGGQRITIYSGTGQEGDLIFADGTTGNEQYRGTVRYDHADDAMKFYTNGGFNAMIINSAQGVQVTNTVGVGAATPSTSGAGITFPATQSASSNANTLDDYEEGTFTPVLGTSNGGTATMTLQEGKYVKVGKIVQFSLQITWTAKNTWDFNTRISGLPFTATSNTGGYGWPNSCQMDANALTTLFIYGIESNSTIGYIQVINNATGAQLTQSSFPSSGRVLVNGCYQTT